MWLFGIIIIKIKKVLWFFCLILFLVVHFIGTLNFPTKFIIACQIRSRTKQSLLQALFYVTVLWLLGKMKVTTVLKNFSKLPWNIFHKSINAYRQFSFQNFLIFSITWFLLKILPRKWAFQKINQHINYTFQIISPTLLNTQMIIDRCISWCAC